jgi:hypothetical protein
VGLLTLGCLRCLTNPLSVNVIFVSLPQNIYEFQPQICPTKADADSTTDSPVPSSSPAVPSTRQPAVLSNILAMRQRLHCKQQIALLHDGCDRIRLIRERLTPQPVAPTTDDGGLQGDAPEVVSLKHEKTVFSEVSVEFSSACSCVCMFVCLQKILVV